MSSRWYDTKPGIARHLTSLKKLNRLVEERFRAGYARHERLHDFCVLGRWTTDSCGNFCKIVSRPPAEINPSIPDVVTMEELWDYLPPDASITSSHMVSLPPTRILCALCDRPWTIDDCHDTEVLCNELVTVNLEPFVGKPLSKVKRRYAARTDAEYFLLEQGFLRNDRYIDLRPNPRVPELKANEHGWVGKSEGIDDSYIIQPGDEACFNTRRYYHGACNRRRLNDDERRHFTEILTAAGYSNFGLAAIPNGYGGGAVPWFRITTHVGTLTVGWRRRVISIDWSDTREDMLELFRNEQVTKGSNYIHAHGKEAAIDYLRLIRLELERRGS
jgi:hypothetical protein